jgi:RNA-directed DNA polymerase
MATQKLKKKQKLRNNEYYSMQGIYDELYSKAKSNQAFTNLYDIVVSDENILLAYRNIKRNNGSKTKGTNSTTIIDVGEQEPERYISYVKNRLANFRPMSVRRVEIPKENGKTRPLGIPTMEDRLIQQCIKQVLEPICEAKFFKHSYGFRPNRSTHHAIARVLALTNRHNFQYVVDIDIKGFFDNVNHGKLLKQLWTLGIRDKRLINIISKMLKAEIEGIGVPTKGVPQGGVLSPLLSNVVLNELDWWIASQWENHKTHTQYKDPTKKYELMRKGNLKEVFIVRYADDFKLFCKDRATAKKMFIATQLWLMARLGLEISPEKSRIVNLKKQYSEFLGIKLRLWKKGEKYVVKSHMTDKSIEKCKTQLKDKVKVLQHDATGLKVQHFNATVLGLHGYYRIASHVSKDFAKIAFQVYKSLYCRTKCIRSRTGIKSKAYKKFYGKSNAKTLYIQGVALYPIHFVQTTPPVCFSQDICNYTPKGRAKIHDYLRNFDYDVLLYLMKNPVIGQGTEYNDNRISLYVGQRGMCYVTGERLQISSMEAHHKLPRYLGGTDEYRNLVFVTSVVHRLIHATTTETIELYLSRLNCVSIDFERLNKLRALVGNCEISVNK